MTTPSRRSRPLTTKQAVFVAEYLTCLNASEAARRAGYSVKTAEWIGPQLLGKTHVSAAIAEQQAARMERLGIDADGLVKLWSAVAQANPNDITQYRRHCCRYCWGQEHTYQYTPAEFEKARIKHIRERAKLLKETTEDIGDFKGVDGDWFDKRRHPNNACPECFGEGVGETFINDTRMLRPDALALYAGVKEGRDGIEVKLHDRQAATEKLGRALGVFSTAEEGAAAGVLSTELAMQFAERMARARERQEQVLRERGITIDVEESE